MQKLKRKTFHTDSQWQKILLAAQRHSRRTMDNHDRDHGHITAIKSKENLTKEPNDA